jgi:hypothetical protein
MVAYVQAQFCRANGLKTQKLRYNLRLEMRE